MFFQLAFFEMYMGVLPVCIFVRHEHGWSLRKPEEDPGSPWVGVTDCCEVFASGCWYANLGPLQEQPLLLTAKLSI